MPENPFAALLRRRADEWGDKAFLADMAGREISYRQTWATAAAWSLRLRELGVRADDRVLVHVGNRPEYVLAWYACQLAGATMASANPNLPGDSQRHLLGIVEPSVCLTHAGAAPIPEVAEAGVRTVDLADLGPLTTRVPDDYAAVEFAEGHFSQIIFTSGTTGRPKAAIQTATMLDGQLLVAQRIGLTPADRMLATSPLFHGLGQGWFQFAMASGATVVIADRFSASRMWQDCREHGITAMLHVGAMLSFLLDQPGAAADRDHRVRISFGVGAPSETWRQFRERFGVDVVEFYGMTEVGLIAFNDPPGRIGSVGLQAATCDLRLVGDDGVDVVDGEVGEAWVRAIGGGTQSVHYFGDPEATAAAQTDGWFRTGDLLRREPDGYLYFIGRSKESLRRRGENIVPEDVERTVRADPEVLECAAVAVPSRHGDDDIRLCIVVAGDDPLGPDPESLAHRLAERLPAAMSPRYVTFLSALPYTATSKLQRRLLRATQEPTWDLEQRSWVSAPPVVVPESSRVGSAR